MTDQRLNDNSQVRIHPQVVLQKVGNEAVLLHQESGIYFGLNAVGNRMVEALQASADVAAACSALLEVYDADAEKLRRDLERLVEKMKARGLVTVE